jgi:hypothetical protein
MDMDSHSSHTVVKIVHVVPPGGELTLVSLTDPRIVGLVAELALAARPREPDPVVAALRGGQRRALRHLVEATP